MVIGARVIGLLRHKKHNVEELYQLVKKEHHVTLDRYYGVIAFLWMTDVIDLSDFSVSLKK